MGYRRRNTFLLIEVQNDVRMERCTASVCTILPHMTSSYAKDISGCDFQDGKPLLLAEQANRVLNGRVAKCSPVRKSSLG